MKTETVAGQESWVVETGAVNAAVSVQGAMMAPVDFRLAPDRTVAPYYINPWHGEDLSAIEPPVLKPLRGDFFCCPFGAANKTGGEDHSVHGEAAYKPWKHESIKDDSVHTRLTLNMDYSACPGRITRELLFGKTTPSVISRGTLEGFSGKYPLGYHAILRGGQDEGLWKLYTDTFDLGATCPDFVLPMADDEYYALDVDARFESLEAIPTRWKNPSVTDCSLFPARPGFIDLFAIYRRRSSDLPLEERLSWTVAVNRSEKFLWYTIKDASVLPATVFWWENGGRHGAPWSGRNCCLGIEETCSYFASGRTESIAENPVSREGIPTAATLSPDKPSRFWTLQGVLPIDDPDLAVVNLSLDRGRPVFTDGNGGTHLVEITLPEVV